MKKEFKKFAFLAILIPGVFLALNANSSVFAGADVGLKNTGFKTGFGSGVFKNTHKMGRVFVGTDILPNLDVEVYVEKTLGSSKKDVNDNTNKVNFINVGTGLLYKFDIDSCSNFKPVVGVGVKQIRVKLNDNTKDAVVSVNKSKLTYKLTTGAEYMFNDYLGSRALVSFENTARLKHTADDMTFKLRNSVGGSIGMFVRT